MKIFFDGLGWVGGWSALVLLFLNISPKQDWDGKYWDRWIPLVGSGILATIVLFILLAVVYG